ncbi:MAG: integrase [Acidobacteria bacterium]|nr:MAG: integrase [Acidobacteriota bacterium]
MKLTAKTLSTIAAPPGKADHVEWDDATPGFGVRLRGASKTWIIQYRIGRQQRRESLGDVRKVSLDDARTIARQRFALVQLGTDPVAERRREQATAELTLTKVAGRYLDAKHGTMRPSSHQAATRYLRKHWAPLAERPLAEIKREHIAARLQELVTENGRIAAARARDCLASMYSWAIREGLCETNVALATNDPEAGVAARDRILSDAEIKALWQAAGDGDFGRVVRLLLLTGCRRSEIGGLKWSEISDDGTLSISGARTKSGRPLVLPLPPAAIALLPPRGASEYVFGPRGKPMCNWSNAKLQLDAYIATTTKQTFTWRLHDLRRTMRSGLGRLGVIPHIAELAIGHGPKGLTKVYDRYTYVAEVGSALARWAEHVTALVEERAAKVTALRA